MAKRVIKKAVKKKTVTKKKVTNSKKTAPKKNIEDSKVKKKVVTKKKTVSRKKKVEPKRPTPTKKAPSKKGPISKDIPKPTTTRRKPLKSKKSETKFIKVRSDSKNFHEMGQKVQKSEVVWSHYAVDGNFGYHYYLIKK